jgi:hypothetical protein
VGTPRSPIPRLFYRVAWQRLEEAEVLLNLEYYTGAVYLAGYSVECILKTLILDAIPKNQHESVASKFRGQDAHNYDSLRHRYSQTNSPPLPRAIQNSLLFVSTWNTSLRYQPGRGNSGDADRFLREVKAIMDWADNRI